MVLEGMAITLPEETINSLHNLIRIFEAVGGLIIAYIVFNIINIIFNRKNRNEFKKMRKAVESIDKKMNKIIKGKR